MVPYAGGAPCLLVVFWRLACRVAGPCALFRDRAPRVGRVVLDVFGSRCVVCCACCVFRAACCACWACWRSLSVVFLCMLIGIVCSACCVLRVLVPCACRVRRAVLAQHGLETVPAARSSVSVYVWQGVLRNSVLRVACRVRPSLLYGTKLCPRGPTPHPPVRTDSTRTCQNPARNTYSMLLKSAVALNQASGGLVHVQQKCTWQHQRPPPLCAAGDGAST
jgi:hypothetical protein